MTLIHTILAFLIAIGILITFHELGHYLVARLCNVKVLRFSLGMGKVIFSRRFGADQTEWAISVLPLGGYVKMLDLREQDDDAATLSSEDLKREFTHQSVWKRIAIVAAGPIANFLLAIILFAVLFMVGVPEPLAKLRQPAVSTEAYQAGIRGNEFITAVNGKPIALWSELHWELLQLALDKKSASLTLETKPAGQSHQVILPLAQLTPEDLQTPFLHKLGLDLAFAQAQLGDIKPDGAAMRAGLEKGDTVLKIDGKPILDSLDLIETVRAAPHKLLHFTVERAGQIRELSVTPDAVTIDGEQIGKINVDLRSLPEMQLQQDGFFTAIGKATLRTWDTSVLILKTLGKMVIGQASLKNVTGPLTIADFAGQTAKIGWISYVSFLALISVSLAVMNLLPIPVLDGGHLMYYALEILTGRPVSTRFMEMGQRLGITLLMLLMMVAFYNDIVRLLTS